MAELLLIEGCPTTDGRMIANDVTTWRDLPLPVIRQKHNASDNYWESEQVGLITDIVRDGNRIYVETDCEIPDGFVLTADGDQTEAAWADDVMLFSSYRVMGAHVTLKERAPWPDEVGPLPPGSQAPAHLVMVTCVNCGAVFGFPPRQTWLIVTAAPPADSSRLVQHRLECPGSPAGFPVTDG